MRILDPTHLRYMVSVVTASLAGLASPLSAQSSNTVNSGITGSNQIAPSHFAVGFLEQVKTYDEFEQQAAKLGVRRAQNPQLQQFAKQLLERDSDTQKELGSFLQAHGLPLTAPLPANLTRQLASLDRQSGPAFDQNLAICLLKESAQSYQQSTRALEQLQKPAIRQFVQALQREQKQRVHEAAQIAQAIGVSQNTINTYLDELVRAQPPPPRLLLYLT